MACSLDRSNGKPHGQCEEASLGMQFFQFRAGASPSPGEFEAQSDVKSEADLALDITSALVDEQLGREHLRPKPRTNPVWAASSHSNSNRGQRPARLEGSVVGVDHPCPRTREAITKPTKSEVTELPAFKHLAALEEAVQNGEALAGCLPPLPAAMGDVERPVDFVQASGAGATLRAAGGGLLAKAPLVAPNTSPRFFFGEDYYGMQAPIAPGSRKHAASGATAFGSSMLRGAPLRQNRYGSHASALWVSTEKVRLNSEAAKPFGSSAIIAFLQNDGPQALDPLRRELVSQENLA